MKNVFTLLLALSISTFAWADKTLTDIECGRQVTITATAVTGYHFDHWSDGNTQNPRTVTISETATYRAYFAANEYEIKFVNYDGTVLQTTTYQYGQTPSFNGPTPQRIDPTGAVTYTFSGWSPALTTVTADATYEAQFTPSANYATITAVASDPTMGTVTGGGQLQIGTTATLTATPADACYEFVRWSDGDTSNPRTFTVSADATYTAVFRRFTYDLTVETDNPAQGSVDAVLVPLP